jgi:hypothetical protein
MIAPEWMLKDNCDIEECDRDVLVVEINKLRAALIEIRTHCGEEGEDISSLHIKDIISKALTAAK